MFLRENFILTNSITTHEIGEHKRSCSFGILMKKLERLFNTLYGYQWQK